MIVITENITIYLVVFVIAFLHELGHFVVAKALGVKVEGIRIQPFGVCLALNNEKFSNNNEIYIAAAGPLVNVLLLLVGVILHLNVINLPEIYFYANLCMLFINLLPVLPLDGGRVLRGIMSAQISKTKIKITLHTISVLVAVFVFVLGVIFFVKSGFNISLLLVSLFLLDNAGISDSREKQLTSLYYSKVTSDKTEVYYVNKDTLVKDALKTMPHNRINIIYVIDDNGKIDGTLTNKYIYKLMCKGCLNKSVSDVAHNIENLITTEE